MKSNRDPKFLISQYTLTIVCVLALTTMFFTFLAVTQAQAATTSDTTTPTTTPASTEATATTPATATGSTATATTPTTATTMDPIYKVLTPTADCTAGTDKLRPAEGCFTGMGAVTARIWYDIMAVCDSLVLAVLIWIAFMNILRVQLDSYAVKKFLPTFIMAIVLANFSFLITRMMLDLGNVAISAFLTGNQQNGITGAFNGLIAEKPRGPVGFTGNYAGYISVYLLKQIFVGVAAVLVAILAFIFLIRNYFLYFLVAIAPAAFLAMVLPLTKKYFQQWFSQFLKWIFMPVISVFWLWLAGEFIGAISQNGTWVLPVGFAGLCLYMAITSPFKAGGAAVGAWSKLGKNVWNKTGGQATKWAGGQIKERASDVGLRSRLMVAGTRPYQAVLGEKSAVGKYVSRVKSSTAERKLRLQGPQMVREKQEKDAKLDAAYRIAQNARTSPPMKKRMVSLIRNENSDERKTYEQWGLQAQLDELKFNADNTVVTSDHNDGTAIPKNAPYTEFMLKQMGIIEQIKYQLRRRNQLDPAEQTIANNIIAGNPVSAGGAPRTLGFWSARSGAVVPDIRRTDPSGYNSSAVPNEQAGSEDNEESATAPAWPQHSEEDRRRFVEELTGTPSATVPQQPNTEPEEATSEQKLADLSNVETLLGEINEALQQNGQPDEAGNTNKTMANIAKPSNVGLGIASIPELNVRIKSIDPVAGEQLRILQTRVQRAGSAKAIKMAQEQESTLQAVARILKDGQSPAEIESLVTQGRQRLDNGDFAGAREIALKIAPESETSLSLGSEPSSATPATTPAPSPEGPAR